jgi:nicotinate phosphoribosyltransferase
MDESKAYELFDAEYTWKRKIVTNFHAKRLLARIFDKGMCVYESPKLKDIKSYCKEQLDTLWDEVKRFENPHKYYVDLSKPLWEMKEKLLQEYSVK